MEQIHEKRTSSFYIRSDYDSKTQIAFVSGEGLLDLALVKETFETLMNHTVKNTIRAVITDAAKVRGTYTKLNPWFRDTYFPHMQKHGFLCFTSIVDDPCMRFATNMIIQAFVPKGLDAKLTPNIDEAKRWVYDKLEMTPV
jgi:hypothetical protein